MTDEERRNQYNLSRATKRLKRDLNLILTESIPSIHVLPNEDDILDWHFVIQGRVNTPYENGMYYGRLVFPPNFPFGPPKILFLTPNGRFKVNERICFSLSDFHPEEWKPAYSVTAVLRGVYDFMHETTETIGSIETSDCVRRQLAIDSKRYNNNNDTFRRMFPDLLDNEMVEDAFPVNESEMSLSDEFHPIHTATDEYQMDTNFVRPPPPTPGLVNDNTTQGLSNIIIPAYVNIDDSQHRANIEYHNSRQEFDESPTVVNITTSSTSEHNTANTNEFQITNEGKHENMEVTKSEFLENTDTFPPTQRDNIVIDKDVIEYYRQLNEPIPGMVENTYNSEVEIRSESTYISRDTPTPVTAVTASPITKHSEMTFTHIFPLPNEKEIKSSFVSEPMSPVLENTIGSSTPNLMAVNPPLHPLEMEEHILLENSNPNFTINGNSTPVDYTILTQVPTVSPEIPHEQVTKRSKYISRITGNSQIKRTLSPQNDINLSKRSKYSPRVGRKLSHIKTSSSRSRNFQEPLSVARHIPFTITPTAPPYIHPPDYRIGECTNSYLLGENISYYNRPPTLTNLRVKNSANTLLDKTQVLPKEKIPSMYRSKGDDYLRDIEDGRWIMKRRFTSLGVTTSEINCYYFALLLIAFLFAIGLLYLLAVLTITLK